MAAISFVNRDGWNRTQDLEEDFKEIANQEDSNHSPNEHEDTGTVEQWELVEAQKEAIQRHIL